MGAMGVVDKADPKYGSSCRDRLFGELLQRNLVYNTCWEDPALDRVALNLEPRDRVAMITSAGCNALDYLLAGAGEVNAVDMNPTQNALLELKVAAIRSLSFPEFFQLFGKGRSPAARAMYHDAIRGNLSSRGRQYWDRSISFFEGRRPLQSFYYRGSSGFFARAAVFFARVLRRLRAPLDDLLHAGDIAEQERIYRTRIRDRLWTPWLRWILSRKTTLHLVGVPEPQYREITTQYPGGIVQHIRDSLETVLTRLPLRDNYFWRVYLQGHYTEDCSPEYLKPENFALLKGGLLDRLKIHTSTMTEFLRRSEPGFTKLVLLDHMDWLSWKYPRALADEWEAILDKAGGARVLFRSGGLNVSYLDPLPVRWMGRKIRLGRLLEYDWDLAEALHETDRVHTYGSFYIADIRTA